MCTLFYGTGEKAVLDKSCYSVLSSDPFSASNVLRVGGRFPVLHKSINCVLLGNSHVRPLLEACSALSSGLCPSLLCMKNILLCTLFWALLCPSLLCMKNILLCTLLGLPDPLGPPARSRLTVPGGCTSIYVS